LTRKQWAGGLALAVLIAVLGTESTRFVDARGAATRSRTLHLKVDRAIAESLNAGATTFRVLLKLRPGTEDRIAENLAKRGHPPRLTFPSTHTLAADLDAATLEYLSRDPGVDRISSDAVVQSSGITWTSSTSASPDNRLVRSLGMENWAPDGKGVVVAVIDSGVVANSNLQSAAKYDFSTGVAKKAAGGDLRFDAYGHGSHIASLIGNIGAADDAPYRGVAAGASVLALKVLDANGAGYTSNVIAAIEFCIANKYALKIDIINLSLGHPIYEPAQTDPLVQAVERAVQAGMAVIVAAGNHGVNDATGHIGFAGITSPGNAPSAITVGAVDAHGTQTLRDDAVAPYSSRGPTWYDGFAKPDVVVSGHRLAGLTGDDSYLSTNYRRSVVSMPGAGHKYLTLSGTSMAAAVASGVAAQVLKTARLVTGVNTLTFDGKLPSSMANSIQSLCSRYAVSDCRPFKQGMTPSLLKAILQFSAIPIPGTHVLEQGAGELNPMGAFELAKRVSVADIEKRFQTNDFSFEGNVAFGTTPRTRVGSETWTWSQQIIWGDRVVWDELLHFYASVWGTQIIWGDHIIAGTQIIWGDRINWNDNATSVVWSDRTLWGDRIVWGDRFVSGPDSRTWLNDEQIIWGDTSSNVNDLQIIWGDLRQVAELWGLTAWSPSVPDVPYTPRDPF
jgi:serine protease AprX